MSNQEKLLYETQTKLEHYQVVDMFFEGRAARILFNGDRLAAFSGMPLDGEQELLFDYIQRLFELVSTVRPKRLLMIGGGVYTLPIALVQALPDITIDVIEIDEGLDEIAEGFFGFIPNKRLNIIHAEGQDFLRQTDQIYDMVVIDAFTGLDVPAELASTETIKLIHKNLTHDGIVAMNIIASYRGRNARAIQHFYSSYKTLFEEVIVYPADSLLSLWTSQNLILTAQKTGKLRPFGMRTTALGPPPTSNK